MNWQDKLPPWARRAIEPLQPLIRSVQLWNEADGGRMSAAMSFYGILSLAPLMLVLVAVLGWWMDREALTTGLVGQISGIVGERGAAAVRDTLATAAEPSQSIVASLVGFGVLVFAATRVFIELQEAFERVWAHGREAPPDNKKWWHMATVRLRGFGYILAFGFLMLVSLAMSTLLAMFSGWAGEGLALETVLRALNEVVALLVAAGLFFGLMRLSGGSRPPRRFLMIGAFLSAILFTIGKQVMTVYLSTAAVVSAYGAAGSLIVLLMWIYFSSAVLLLGASSARALQEARGAKENADAAAEAAGTASLTS